MASLSVPSFSNGTTADANAVTGNFNNVKTFVENQLVQIDGSVKAPTVAIADLAITTGKIADSAVTAAKIADGTVGTAELANDSVTADKVLDGATLPVNITGSAASANTANSAVTAAGLSDAGGQIYWTGYLNQWQTPSNFQCSSLTAYGSLYTSGQSTFNGVMYYTDPGPSSATEGIVRISSTGELKKNSASAVSSREYKEDIVPIEGALEKVSLLQPRNFRFKEEALIPNEPYDVFNRRTQLQYGFVMEEVQDAIPDLVMHKSPDGVEHAPGYWKESGVIALAVKAIQELSAKVEALELKVAELEAK